jgi:hypothetical protein
MAELRDASGKIQKTIDLFVARCAGDSQPTIEQRKFALSLRVFFGAWRHSASIEGGI